MTTALNRVRTEQEALTNQRLDGAAFTAMHRKWLALQRTANKILRGELCREHGFEGCGICKPAGPLRQERG
jgi:hypothetical protein